MCFEKRERDSGDSIISHTEIQRVSFTLHDSFRVKTERPVRKKTNIEATDLRSTEDEAMKQSES